MREPGPGDSRRRIPASRPSRDRSAGSLEDQALSLREEGRSYAAVAQALGMERSLDAQAAFLRALRRLDPELRGAASSRELERLDQLEARIRARDQNEPDKMARRLGALDKLRVSVRQVSDGPS